MQYPFFSKNILIKMCFYEFNGIKRATINEIGLKIKISIVVDN